MSYTKPAVKAIEVDVQVRNQASNQTSCYGGHCARAKYSGDC